MRRVGVRAPEASGAQPPKGCMHDPSEWFIAVAPALQAPPGGEPALPFH